MNHDIKKEDSSEQIKKEDSSEQIEKALAEINKALADFPITIEECKKWFKSTITDSLIFEDDSYKITTNLKAGDFFNINKIFSQNLREIASVFSKVNSDEGSSLNVQALMRWAMGAIPVIMEIILDDDFQDLVLNMIKKSDIIKKDPECNIKLNKDDVQKITFDDVFVYDLTLYTKMSVAFIITTLSVFFFTKRKNNI